MWDPFSSLSLCCHFYACLLEWYLLNHPTWNISTISNYQTDMPVNQTSNQDLSEIFLSINSNHRNVIFFASFQPSGNSLKKNTTSSLSVIKPNFWLMLLNERKSTSPIYEGVEMVYFWMKYASPSDPNASYPTGEKSRSRRSVTSFWWSADIWPGIYQKSRLRLPETHQEIIIHRELWNRRLPGILWDTGRSFPKKKGHSVQILKPMVIRQSKREFPNFRKIIHPGRLTWNLNMMVWKMIFLFNWVIFRFQPFNLPGCIQPQLWCATHSNFKIRSPLNHKSSRKIWIQKWHPATPHQIFED